MIKKIENHQTTLLSGGFFEDNEFHVFINALKEKTLQLDAFLNKIIQIYKNVLN